MLEILLQSKAEVEALSGPAGLKIIRHCPQEGVARRCSPHGQQKPFQAISPIVISPSSDGETGRGHVAHAGID